MSSSRAKAFPGRVPRTRKSSNPVLRVIELACFGVGLGLIAFYAVAQTDSAVAQWVALKQFEAVGEPDKSLWDAGRIKEYQESLTVEMDDPVGVLRIPKIDLTVAVFNDSSDLSLNRGAGRIRGTAPLGSYGNAGISAHRDGFFRGLKDLEVGDIMDVDTTSGSKRFRISEITIVEKKDLNVLDDSYEPMLTLVTCYPFYYVGSAPKRYIVRGVLDETDVDTRT